MVLRPENHKTNLLYPKFTRLLPRGRLHILIPARWRAWRAAAGAPAVRVALWCVELAPVSGLSAGAGTNAGEARALCGQTSVA